MEIFFLLVVRKFRIGLVIPWNDTFDGFSGYTSASAVSMAIERVHSDEKLNRTMKFE